GAAPSKRVASLGRSRVPQRDPARASTPRSPRWLLRHVIRRSGPLPFLNQRQPTDQVLVKDAHQMPRLFITSPNLLAHSRKLVADLLAKLHKLQLETRDSFRQLFE